MPKRQDLKRVMIISSGPIVIGQGCEFDYSGTQACKALREEGISIVLLNSNPATIMTDPEMADRTYIEPITVETIDKILARERELGTPVDALLPTLGGQTGLNCAMEAAEAGVLNKHGVQLIGANEQAIHKAEDRTEFKNAMLRIGLDVPRSGIAHTWEEAQQIIKEIGLPVAIRPAYTLGGTGGGFATNMQEFETIAKRGLEYSRVSEILIEESALGWKEYELEVMRDRADNVVIICSIENFDAMGVHTGDSITVAPAQTLTDKEYQRMRDAAIRIIREIGVETGGSNIQFAVHPKTGRMVVVEMNPRVSRSSALASKATGYPIARIAAKLAIGYTLDEIPNDITRKTPASFEPTIDYCVVKIPRWTFEKFPEANETLTTQMKSVGEAMSIGRTFKEALQKGIRSMEIKRFGLGLDGNDLWLASLREKSKVENRKSKEPRASARAVSRAGMNAAQQKDATSATQEGVQPRTDAARAEARGSLGDSLEETPPRIVKSRHLSEPPADTKEEHATEWPIPLDVLRDKLEKPCQGRPYYIRYAFKMGWTVEQVHELTYIDPWFLENMKELVEFEEELIASAPDPGDPLGLNTANLEVANQIARAIGASDPAQVTATATHHRVRQDVKLRDLLQRAKQWGYSDVQIAKAWNVTAKDVRWLREWLGVKPVYKLVDTCAAEFEAVTPYYYSTYETPSVRVTDDHNDYSSEITGELRQLEISEPDDEIRVSDRPKVIILGGGPNRIGQGIEFDYCCVHAVMQTRAMGYETVMVNSNPETVSTDYDTSDLLFFEPLTHEDVLNICERLNGGPWVSRGLTFQIEDKWRLPRDTEIQLDNNWREHGPGPGVVIDQTRGGGAVEPMHIGYMVATSEGHVWQLETNTKGEHFCSRIDCEAPAFKQHFEEKAARAAKLISARRNLVKGVIVQYGGQTPLNLAKGLKDAGVPILGTSPESIHLAEDRNEFQKIVRELGLRQPEAGIAYDLPGAIEIARKLGYPVLVRPSYVLGGRAMEKCHIEEDLVRYMKNALDATDRAAMVDEAHPILIDKFLSSAVEVDVDCISDGKRALVCGLMEHIEEAGIHSGDSACALPPYTLSPALIDEIKRQTELIAHCLNVCGLMNVQYAVKDELIYLIEVNPRASRTVPFVSKATGVPWAKLATQVMLGRPLDEVLREHGIDEAPWPHYISVKEVVFPFNKFPEVDVILGPEMRSTGEVMGIDRSFPLAFAKAQMAAGGGLPREGTVLISVNDHDKQLIVPIAREFHQMGFRIISTAKTREALLAADIPAELVKKKQDPEGPYLIDMIHAGQVNLLINTPIYWGSAAIESRIRSAAVMHNIPLVTTITGARAAAQAIRALREGDWGVRSIQEHHASL